MTQEWEEAVRRGVIDDLQRLLAGGADIDAKNKHGQTALMLAAAEGHPLTVEWLIEHGASPDHTAKYGLSALMLAVIRGHVEVVRKLAGAGLGLRGTGAPGFAGKTALDLAIAQGNLEMVEILRSAGQQPSNPHFATASSWRAARAMVTFRPLQPRATAGLKLQSIRIHVRDHKLRELSLENRTLEAHYGRFVLTQAWKGTREAQRLALEVSYGQAARDARIAECAARVYELGPEPPPDDIDGRSPAVVTWSDADMFYLIASEEMSADALVKIALSLYEGRPGRD